MSLCWHWELSHTHSLLIVHIPCLLQTPPLILLFFWPKHCYCMHLHPTCGVWYHSLCWGYHLSMGPVSILLPSRVQTYLSFTTASHPTLNMVVTYAHGDTPPESFLMLHCLLVIHSPPIMLSVTPLLSWMRCKCTLRKDGPPTQWCQLRFNPGGTWPDFRDQVYVWLDAMDICLVFHLNVDMHGWSNLSCEVAFTAALTCVRERALAAHMWAVSMEVKSVVSKCALHDQWYTYFFFLVASAGYKGVQHFCWDRER